jgi:hypothetical protein
VDEENFEEIYSVKYKYMDEEQTEIDYNDPSVFCYDTDNSSIDESYDDIDEDEHDEDNSNKILNETELKFK